jgi:integrase/recombinase XerD
LPLHPDTGEFMDACLQAVGHGAGKQNARFRPVRNTIHNDGRASITPDAVNKMHADYGAVLKINIASLGPHVLRATAASNALNHEEDSPAFRITCQPLLIHFYPTL